MSADDLNPIPDDTVVTVGVKGGNRFTAYAYAGGLWEYTGGTGQNYDHALNFHGLRVQPFVPVPVGMTVDEAASILDQHRPWVPLPDGPTEAHVGKRVRIVYGGGHVEGRIIRRFETTPRQYLLHGMPKQWSPTSGDWFVHPDDVPADPDAALVQAVADAIEPLVIEGKVVAQTHGAWFRDMARAALAVVRESEARP